MSTCRPMAGTGLFMMSRIQRAKWRNNTESSPRRCIHTPVPLVEAPNRVRRLSRLPRHQPRKSVFTYANGESAAALRLVASERVSAGQLWL